jgi:hypothetical protein
MRGVNLNGHGRIELGLNTANPEMSKSAGAQPSCVCSRKELPGHPPPRQTLMLNLANPNKLITNCAMKLLALGN